MATPRVTRTDPRGRVVEMQATPAASGDPAFDSYMIFKETGHENHTLTLVLKLHMDRIAPTVVAGVQQPYADWDGTQFAIKPWRAHDLAAFRKLFLHHCAHWNNKFWLTPPPTFAAFDYKLGSRTVRPNIYCHLYVAIMDTAAGSHRTISIVNLDRPAAARQLGKRQRDLNASDFRSDSATYDSLDVKPVPLPFRDSAGRTQRLSRSTIAHEIGHALGLDHSGVPHGAPLCTVSVLADSFLPSAITSLDSFPAIYRGGSNSQACYGESGPARVGANVMGYGLEFDETNAQPWLDRIALHTSTAAADWKVSVKKRLVPKVT